MFQQNAGIRITKFLILETGSYNQQYRRPFTTNLDGSTLHMFHERLDGATGYSPNMMSGLAGNFVMPMATPEDRLNISEGWGERRMRFLMEVEHTKVTGGRTTEVIMGYTDHAGITASGNLDDNMIFYINSTMQTRVQHQNTPYGTQSYTTMVDNSLVLANPQWDSVYAPRQDNRMRPEDVYSTMTRAHLSDAASIMDTRAVVTNAPVKSRRQNNLAGSYVSRILDDYRNATADTNAFGQSHVEVYNAARGNAAESLASSDPFISAIANIRNMPPSNMFTIRDLKQLCPNLNDVTQARALAPTERANVHQTGQTADWGAADRVTLVATILTQSVPSIMMDLGLIQLAFASSNQNIGGMVSTTIMNVETFSGDDASRSLDSFCRRLEMEILNDISWNNQTDFAIQMQADLLGETWLKISVDGGPSFDYVAPSFCDALTSPMLTADNELNVKVASDFSMLIDNMMPYAATDPGFGHNIVQVGNNASSPFGKF